MAGNPWFKPKRVGFGASPANWQGWLVTALFGLLFAWIVIRLHGGLRWGFALLLVLCYAALVYFKSSDAWRWRSGNV